MMHFDFQVGDLGSAVTEAVVLGATLADLQSQEKVRVMFDPAGHLFCPCSDGHDPDRTQARTVLGAIGSGERTFTNIARAAGGLAATLLRRALSTLTDKHIVAAEPPVSLRASKEQHAAVRGPIWYDFLVREWYHI